MMSDEHKQLAIELLRQIKSYDGIDFFKETADKLVTIPTFICLPDKKLEQDCECGTFKWDYPDLSYNKCFERLEDHVSAGFYHIMEFNSEDNLGNLFDYVFVYTENKFCDNDGAGIMMNVNPVSPAYKRMIIYESFDDARFTPLSEDVTLDKIISMAKSFKPNNNSDVCSEVYFVSYLAAYATK